ncbi:hypothetical protein DYQ86_13575 [Acidobacteria bacterium AB60]|nr:hypothetical protein DYQ86_13575 [Acidobacteria bacterium AB60]
MLVDPVPVSRRVVKPAECVLAFGIPTTRESFERALTVSGTDYAKQFRGGWSQYYALLAKDVENVESPLREEGVTIVHDLTLEGFAALFERPFPAIILFSHWKEDAVEFSDGMASAGAVLAAVPEQFDGILDLCVCHPMALVAALHKQRPGCLVKYLPVEAKPHFWMYFYKALFLHLKQSDVSYLTAIQEVACAFLDTAQAGETLSR